MGRYVKFSTNLMVFFAIFISSKVASAQEQPVSGFEAPLFRTAGEGPAPRLAPGTKIRLVTDQDIPPYSFLASSGSPAGLSVEIVLAACAAIAADCTVTVRPFADLMAALRGGEADAVIAGPKLDEKAATEALATRPYFRTMGRFAVQSGSPLKSADAASLAGKKIGAVRGTLHARWLEAYYSGSEIVPFEDGAAAGNALRTGAVDAVFDDDLRMIYWLAGDGAKGCCRPLGGAYSDFDFFSRNLVMLVARARPDLRAAFDYGLDMAQKNGDTSRILKAYLPLSPW